MATTRSTAVIGAVTIGFQALFIFVPMFILGNAIGWPASLDLPAEEMLPLLQEQLSSVRLGYGMYLLYSLNWIVVGTFIVVLATAGKEHSSTGPLAVVAIAIACISAFSRAVGIIRWLTASTELSDPANSVSEGVETVQLAVNSWGGAIGEYLGVAMFAGIFMIAVSLLLIRSVTLPGWLGWAGFLVALIVAMPAMALFGIELIGVATSTTILHFWLLAFSAVTLIAVYRRKFD